MKTSVQEGHSGMILWLFSCYNALRLYFMLIVEPHNFLATGNIEQRNMFLNLKTIMQCRLKMQKKQMEEQLKSDENMVFGGGERMVRSVIA